jgi:hypothetical protein
VAAGIDDATGELLRTIETVAGERSRYSANILRVAGLSAWGRNFFAVIVLRGMDVQDMATVVHLWLERCLDSEYELRKFVGDRVRWKITKYRQMECLFVTSFLACPTTLFSLRFSMGCV